MLLFILFPVSVAMAIIIRPDHPTFLVKNKIADISNHFLNTFGFNYFQYLRCYADGSIGLLTNHTGLTEYFQDVENAPVIFSSFEKEQENSHTYWFLWDEKLPEYPVTLAREKFNFHNGITLVRRSKNYYDMIAVALPQEQSNAASFYLNKVKPIEQFIGQFDRENKDLLQLMNQNPISLSKERRDVNYEKICLNKGKLPISGKFCKTYITTQELACLRLLLQGYSYKEAAQCLNISPRTVETYWYRLQLRTGFTNLHEAAYMLEAANCQ